MNNTERFLHNQVVDLFGPRIFDNQDFYSYEDEDGIWHADVFVDGLSIELEYSPEQKDIYITASNEDTMFSSSGYERENSQSIPHGFRVKLAQNSFVALQELQNKVKLASSVIQKPVRILPTADTRSSWFSANPTYNIAARVSSTENYGTSIRAFSQISAKEIKPKRKEK